MKIDTNVKFDDQQTNGPIFMIFTFLTKHKRW